METQSNDATAKPGAGQAPDSKGTMRERTATTDDPLLVNPSEAEVDEWAERERKRRESWLSGPTQEERAAWARRERARRLAELRIELRSESTERPGRRRRYPREAQLAAEGAASLLWRWSLNGLAILVRAGREWEEDFAQSGRRRRVPVDDDES